MEKFALLARVVARPGKETEVAASLISAFNPHKPSLKLQGGIACR